MANPPRFNESGEVFRTPQSLTTEDVRARLNEIMGASAVPSKEQKSPTLAQKLKRLEKDPVSTKLAPETREKIGLVLDVETKIKKLASESGKFLLMKKLQNFTKALLSLTDYK